VAVFFLGGIEPLKGIRIYKIFETAKPDKLRAVAIGRIKRERGSKNDSTSRTSATSGTMNAAIMNHEGHNRAARDTKGGGRGLECAQRGQRC
jgi:hypothetical protein